MARGDTQRASQGLLFKDFSEAWFAIIARQFALARVCARAGGVLLLAAAASARIRFLTVSIAAHAFFRSGSVASPISSRRSSFSSNTQCAHTAQ